jgi:hypothetical protein
MDTGVAHDPIRHSVVCAGPGDFTGRVKRDRRFSPDPDMSIEEGDPVYVVTHDLRRPAKDMHVYVNTLPWREPRVPNHRHVPPQRTFTIVSHDTMLWPRGYLKGVARGSQGRYHAMKDRRGIVVPIQLPAYFDGLQELALAIEREGQNISPTHDEQVRLLSRLARRMNVVEQGALNRKGNYDENTVRSKVAVIDPEEPSKYLAYAAREFYKSRVRRAEGEYTLEERRMLPLGFSIHSRR